MKVEAVTPSADASDPAHPDHDRWVKDVTLKREIEHAKRIGMPMRVAETENLRLLELADKKPLAPLTKKKEKNVGHEKRAAARGVIKRAPRPLVAHANLSPCGRCGTCLRCKRERRVAAMCVLAKQGDMRMVTALMNLYVYAQTAKDGTGKFFGVNPRDANRMVIRRLEEICDATIPAMGQWR